MVKQTWTVPDMRAFPQKSHENWSAGKGRRQRRLIFCSHLDLKHLEIGAQAFQMTLTFFFTVMVFRRQRRQLWEVLYFRF